MKSVVQRLRQRARTDDSGMTLIEVIVAISLIGIIATAAIGLSITSQKGTSVQQRKELAVTIASDAMEAVNARSGATEPLTGLNYLLTGRTQGDVLTAWNANTGVSGLATTYPGWDPGATSTSTMALDILKTVSRSGTTYSVYTLIGTCYISTPGGGDCTKNSPGETIPPATIPAGKTPLSRVLVVVRWTAGSGCAASGCSYQTSSLVDAHDDLVWNTHD
ncbi:hypothetical protein GCM10022381_41610 [Leifsonia kafniensis]|uniref:Prepilin-type N-terminal cleavage/methylation domain-containing protein n=1 Tax=Leifsonia kafniensis TaxID=475957 RepID=A0ABP7LB99_9MICO